MSFAGRFRSLVIGPSRYHIYLSRSHEVAINLSIEHYLFTKTRPDSTVLFLYVNDPCIVIGRNQNPWLEVNHALVRARARQSKEEIKVIRRRSGGGTVFHDRGNVNFSVICPPEHFHRDKHAEMVVRAIRKSNLRARVNERHDIVLDPGPLLEMEDHPDPDDTHCTPYAFGDGSLEPRKVSGSAYKIAKGRALHHGTCLLASPNLSSISEYLRSPARPFLKARGVESVRSPVANILDQSDPKAGLDLSTLQHQIVEAFAEMYKLDKASLTPWAGSGLSVARLHEKEQCASGAVDERLVEDSDFLSIRAGFEV